jgi:hypothetical protein
VTPDLETALAFRAKQAHRCYDSALTQDQTLQGHVTINVRVAGNGQVCAASVAANDLSNPSVAGCIARMFGQSGHFPAPRGGCVDANVPISLMPPAQRKVQLKGPLDTLAGMHGRRLLPLLVVPAALVFTVGSGGCTDGTTPDCTLPDAGCSPDTDGSLPVFDASDGGEGGTSDSPAEAQPDAGADAADVGSDASVDAPSDGG